MRIMQITYKRRVKDAYIIQYGQDLLISLLSGRQFCCACQALDDFVIRGIPNLLSNKICTEYLSYFSIAVFRHQYKAKFDKKEFTGDLQFQR